jgi:PAS domain S-box-containing protein
MDGGADYGNNAGSGSSQDPGMLGATPGGQRPVQLGDQSRPGAPGASDPGASQSDPHAHIPPPAADPAGALTTYIGNTTRLAQVDHAARQAQDRSRQEVTAIAHGMTEVAVAMHRHAAELEAIVEGQFSVDLGDPRTRLLSRSLEVARQADLRLAQLEHTLRRHSATVQAAQGNLDALQRERERLSSLYQIAQDLNTALDLRELLGRVTAQLIEVVHAERGFLMLYDETTDQLQFTAARGANGEPLQETDFSISRGVIAGVWSSQEPILTTDAQEDERLRRHESVVVYGIRSVMCAPLRVRGRGVGVVYVDSRTETALFSPAHLDLLAAFCNQAAIAIDNARLFDDLRRHIREISEMKTYMENIFASVASGVVTADTRGIVTAFNRAAERIFNLASQFAVGQPYQRVLASLGDVGLAQAMRGAAEEQRVTLGYELTRELPGRGEVALRLNVSPLRASEGEGEPQGIAMVVDDLTELRRSQRHAEEIQRLFGRYVHPTVVRQLLADPSAINLGGETREVSVVFADIRGFTPLAEQITPEELVRILNQYLNLLTEAVWQEEGTITMFIGDALMALFNAPLPQPDHAVRAVRAAWAMRQALDRYHQFEGTGRPSMQYGIGVHTGLAVVGNIGARGRLQNYTAIGDAVNIAQRLQANAQGGQILVSAATYAAAAARLQASPLDPLLVKGKSQPLQVFQLDGLRGSSLA